MQLKCYVKKLKIMKDKTDEILRLIENPDNYDDIEISKMLGDSEKADIYKTINRTADALSDISNLDIDIDKEWEAFMEKKQHDFLPNRHKVFSHFFSRKIASIGLIVAASMSLIAAGIGVSYSIIKDNKEIKKAEENKVQSKAEAVVVAADTLTSELPPIAETPIKIYKNESLESILRDLSAHYGVSVSYKSESVKNLHLYYQWDRTQSLEETIGMLNHFQQIHIMISDKSIIVEGL